MLGVLMASTQLLAQNRTVSGKVTDPQGAGIPNASVSVKGTSFGTITSADGSFSLAVPANNNTLIVSSVGYQDQQISIEGKSYPLSSQNQIHYWYHK